MYEMRVLIIMVVFIVGPCLAHCGYALFHSYNKLSYLCRDWRKSIEYRYWFTNIHVFKPFIYFWWIKLLVNSIKLYSLVLKGQLLLTWAWDKYIELATVLPTPFLTLVFLIMNISSSTYMYVYFMCVYMLLVCVYMLLVYLLTCMYVYLWVCLYLRKYVCVVVFASVRSPYIRVYVYISQHSICQSP